jgi:hypothetical protein
MLLTSIIKKEKLKGYVSGEHYYWICPAEIEFTKALIILYLNQ